MMCFEHLTSIASVTTAAGSTPPGPRVMSLAAQVVRTARAKKILDLGSGLGYSTLWLAEAAPPDAAVLASTATGSTSSWPSSSWIRARSSYSGNSSGWKA